VLGIVTVDVDAIKEKQPPSASRRPEANLSPSTAPPKVVDQATRRQSTTLHHTGFVVEV
jgi:hypothetical protein